MNGSPETRRSVLAPIIATIIGGSLVAAIASLPFVVGPPNDDGLPDIAKFIGRFHPVVLHLPIGMLVWVFVRETLNVFSKCSDPPSSRTAMGFAAISAVVAALLGFVLYHSTPDYDRELVERHLYGGLAFACLSIAAYVIKVWVDAKNGSGTWLYRAALLISVGIMTITSHDGASLTHGKGYLTDHAPEPLRGWLGMEPRAKKVTADQLPDPSVYAGLIVPILESKCYACHNAEKQKGKYRMDLYESLIAGGKEGEAIVPGNSADSNLVIRIELPESDEEHMPPEGKKDIEDHELVLIKWWIDNGASQDAKIADLPTNDAIKEAIKKSSSAVTEKPKTETTFKADESLKAQVAQLQKNFPAALQFESKDSMHLIFTTVGLREKFGDAELAKLAPILTSMVSLDLSYSALSDDGVDLLATASQLKSLRLAETGIGDAALETLSKLTELESLNLYGTKVTSQGVLKLSELQKLKKLYLWGTQVDEKTLEDLREKLPECEIVTGI
ncbi:MAG: hypothetical protein RLZ22_1532 [Verrucomicrobiota bacterium]|jgi:uncharacterized membrane protein